MGNQTKSNRKYKPCFI